VVALADDVLPLNPDGPSHYSFFLQQLLYRLPQSRLEIVKFINGSFKIDFDEFLGKGLFEIEIIL